MKIKIINIIIALIFAIQGITYPNIGYSMTLQGDRDTLQPATSFSDADFRELIAHAAKNGARPDGIRNILKGLDLRRIRQIIAGIEDTEIRAIVCGIFGLNVPSSSGGLGSSAPGAGTGVEKKEPEETIIAGGEIIESFGMTPNQFRKFCRDIFAFERSVKNDINLHSVSRYLISLRSQWRLANDILFVLPKLKERGIAKAFSHALIYALHNNYTDLAPSDKVRREILEHFIDHCQHWLQGVNLFDDTYLLKEWYGLNGKTEWSDLEKKVARALMGNNPILYRESRSAGNELRDALVLLGHNADIHNVYVHPFTDEAQLIGRRIPREGEEGLEYGHGEILRIVESALKEPDKPHILFFNNLEAMQAGIRIMLQEILRIREITDPNIGGQITLPENIQIKFTMNDSFEFGDDSLLDRVYVKTICPEEAYKGKNFKVNIKNITEETVKGIKIENGRLIIPGFADIQLKDEFKDVTTENMRDEFYKRMGLILDLDTVRMLCAMELSVRQGESILCIEGASGVGKTFTAGRYALLTGRDFSANPISVGTDLSEFIGGYEQRDDGRFIFNPKTTFRELLEKGGVITLSELNALTDDNDMVSLAWWLEQIMEAVPDKGGYRTIYLTEIPTKKGCAEIDRIRIHPKSLIIIDTNPETTYGSRGVFPEIFKDNALKITVDDFIEKEDPKAPDIKQRNINKILMHLDIFLEFPWTEEGKKIADGIENDAERREISSQLAEIFDAFVQMYYSKEIGKSEDIIFTKRELKRLAEDALYGVNVLKKSISESVLYTASINLICRWEKAEDREKADEKVKDILGKEGLRFSMTEFIKDQVLNKYRVGHIHLSSDTDLTGEINLLKEALPGVKIKTITAMDETDRFQMEGGFIPGEDGKMSMERGILGRLISEAENEEGREIIYVIENAHNIPSQEIIALNEFLQDRLLKIKGKQSGRLPLNGHILFISRTDSEIAWSKAEKSRSVHMGYGQDEGFLRAKFLEGIEKRAKHWEHFGGVLFNILNSFNKHFNQYLSSDEAIANRNSYNRYEEILERVILYASKISVSDHKIFIERIENTLKVFSLGGIKPEAGVGLFTVFERDILNVGYLINNYLAQERRRKKMAVAEGTGIPEETWYETVMNKKMEIAGVSSDTEKAEKAKELAGILKKHSDLAEYKEEEINKKHLSGGGIFKTVALITELPEGYGNTVRATHSLTDGRVIIAGYGGAIKIYNPQADELTALPEGYGNIVRAMHGLTDGRVIIAGDGGAIKIYDPQTKELTKLSKGYGNNVWAMHSLTDGRGIIAGTGGAIKIYDPQADELTALPEGYGNNVLAMHSLTDGRVIIAGTGGAIKIYNPQTKKLTALPKGYGNNVWAMHSLTDGRVIIAGHGGAIKIYNPQTNKLTELPEGYGRDVLAMHSLTDGRVIIAGDGGAIKICELDPVCVKSAGERFISVNTGAEYDVSSIPKDEVTLLTPKEPEPEVTKETWYETVMNKKMEIAGVSSDTEKAEKAKELAGILKKHPDLAEYKKEEIKKTLLSDGQIFKTDALMVELPEGYGRDVVAMHSLTDGRVIIAGYGGAIKIYNPQTNKLTALPEGYGNIVLAMHSLTDGRVIIAGWGGAIKIYNPKANKLTKLSKEYGNDVYAMHSLTDGRVIIAGHGGAIKIYNPQADELTALPKGYGNNVWAMHSLTDGRVIIAGVGGAIKIYNPQTNKLTELSEGYGNHVFAMHSLTDGRVIIAGDGGAIKIYDPKANKLTELPEGYGNNVRAMYSLTNGRVIIAGRGGAIKICELEPVCVKSAGERFISVNTGAEYDVSSIPKDEVTLLTPKEPEPEVTKETWYETVRMKQAGVTAAADDAEKREKAKELAGILKKHPDLAEYEEGEIKKTLLSGGGIFKTDALITALPEGYGNNVLAMHSLTDGRVIIAGHGGAIKIYDPQTKKLTKLSEGYGNNVYAMHSLTDGRVIIAGYGGAIKIYNPQTDELTELSKGYGNDVYAMHGLTDGRVIIAGWGGAIKIYNPQADELTALPEGYGNIVWAMHGLTDGRVIIAGAGGAIKIYDPQTNKLTALPEGYGNHVLAMHSLTDGRVIIAGWGGAIKIYNPQTDELTKLSEGYGNHVWAMHSLTDGRVIIAGDGGAIKICELEPVCVKSAEERFISVNTGAEYDVSSIPKDEVTLLTPKGKPLIRASHASFQRREGEGTRIIDFSSFSAKYLGLPFYYALGEDGIVYLNYQGEWYKTKHTTTKGLLRRFAPRNDGVTTGLQGRSAPRNDGGNVRETIYYEEPYTQKIMSQKVRLIQLNDIAHPSEKNRTLSAEDFLMETDVLKEVEDTVLQALRSGWGVDIEGGSGGGKTSIAREIGLLLGLPVCVFQMHGQRNLTDFIGGYSEDGKGNLRRNNISDSEGNFRQELLQAITHGGIFIVDEGAVGKKGRELLNWLSPLLRDRTPGRTISLHEFPGLEIPLTVHPDFHIIITNNEAGRTQAREVVKSEVSSNLVYIYVDEDDGPSTLERLFLYFISNLDIASDLKAEFALELRQFHTELKGRIGKDLGADDKDRHYISKREIRRTAKLLQWAYKDERFGKDPLFGFYTALRIVYESMFTHEWEKEEVKRLIDNYCDKINPEISSDILDTKFNKLKTDSFKPSVRSKIYTNTELEAAFLVKLSIESGEPVLLINELGGRTNDIVRRVMEEAGSEVYIIDANNQQSRTEILGGLFPDVRRDRSKEIAFILGKITEHLVSKDEIVRHENIGGSASGTTSLAALARNDRQPKTIWIRNIDLWSEDLRTALNGFLEEGFLKMETADGSVKTFYRPPHVHFIAEMGAGSVQDFSSAFYNRWIKIGVPAEAGPVTGIYSKNNILRMLGENKQEQLTVLAQDKIIIPLDKKGARYKFNRGFNPEQFPEPLKTEKIYAEFKGFIAKTKSLSDFEIVLMNRYGLDISEAEMLARIYIAVMQIDKGIDGKHWLTEMSYGISASVFYAIAEAVQTAKRDNPELLRLEVELRNGAQEKTYKRHRDLSVKILVNETIRFLGTRFKPDDRKYFDELIMGLFEMEEAPVLDTRIKTTDGTIKGIVMDIGGVPLNPGDSAKSPLGVSRKHQVKYIGQSIYSGLSVMARASQIRKSVVFVGEPGAVKTTLTGHFAEITGRRYYKYQAHKKSRVEDLTIEVLQEADGTFVKNIKQLYENLRMGNVVIDIDEANTNPEILWILEPVIRGEEWIYPIFPGEEPFKIGAGVQLVFTYNPETFAGREVIDPRILDKMIIAWIEAPKDGDSPAIIETFYGVWFEGEYKGGEEVSEMPKIHVPPVEAPCKISEKITYSHEKIRNGIEEFGRKKAVDEKVMVFLGILGDYFLALANRDGAVYNDEIISIAEELDKLSPIWKSLIKKMIIFLQQEYRRSSPNKEKIKWAILELRKQFIPFNWHIVVFMNTPDNRTASFLHLYPNRILDRIRIDAPGWEHSGEAFVIEGKGLEGGNKLGYFDGEYPLVDASKTGGKGSLQTEWTGHHELGHVNDAAPHRIIPKNIELNAMLSPLMHSREKKGYIAECLVPWLSNDPDLYYTQGAKGILNGIILYLWEEEQRSGFAPEIDDSFNSEDVKMVLDIVNKLTEEQLKELAFHLYEHPQYMESGNKGKYKQKAGAGFSRGAKEEVMQGVDGEIEIEIERVSGGPSLEVNVDVPEGNDRTTDEETTLPDELQDRRNRDLEKQQNRVERIQEKIDKEIETQGDEYDKMILGGQGESQAIFGRILRSFQAKKKTISIRLKSGLEIDPVAYMLKLAKRFVKREQIFDIQTQAVWFLGDFSGSLAPFKKQMGYAVRCIGDNFLRLKQTVPKYFYYDMSFYTDAPPVTVMEMGKIYSQEEWEKRCVVMGSEIGKSGNDLLKALQLKLRDFAGAGVRHEIRRARNKTLILFTDGQDNAISGDKPTPELEKVLAMYRELGVEIFAIGFGEGAKPVCAFRGRRQHYIRIREDRPYDVAEAVAKIMEARSQGLGIVPDGDLTDYFGIGAEGIPQIDLGETRRAVYSTTPRGVGKIQETITAGQDEIDMLSNRLGVNRQKLQEIFDRLADKNRFEVLRAVFIKLLMKDGVVTDEEIQVLVDNIRKVRDALNEIEYETIADKKEVIMRIALHLSIQHIKRDHLTEKLPQCMLNLFKTLQAKDDGLEILGRIRKMDIRNAEAFLREITNAFGEKIEGFVHEIRRYLYLRRQVSERMNHGNGDVDILTKYLLGEDLPLDIGKSAEHIVKVKGMEGLAEKVNVPGEVAGNTLADMRKGIESLIQIREIPNNTVILHHAGLYLSGNAEWDSQNLDSFMVDKIRTLVKDKKFVFGYDTNEQKQALISLLQKKGISQAEIEIGFVFVLIPADIRYADIKAMFPGEQLVSAVKGFDERFRIEDEKEDRVIAVDGDGIVDLYLVWNTALLSAVSKTREELKDAMRRFLLQYYKDSVYEKEVEGLLEDMFKSGIWIILPKAAPFVMEYYNAISSAYALINQSA